MRTLDHDILRAIYRKAYDTLAAAPLAELEAADADGRTPLMHAVLGGDLQLIQLLIDRGVDVNVADRGQRWTALHFAARDQNAPAVRSLLDAGAAVDPVDVFGNTPLWRAVMNVKADPAAIRELLARGADSGRKNNHDASPVDVARHAGREDLVAVLEGTK